MGSSARLVANVYAAFGVFTALSVICIFQSLGRRELVTGSANFYTTGRGYFDLAKLQPGAAGEAEVVLNPPPVPREESSGWLF